MNYDYDEKLLDEALRICKTQWHLSWTKDYDYIYKVAESNLAARGISRAAVCLTEDHIMRGYN